MGKNAKERRRAQLAKALEEHLPKNRKHPTERLLSVDVIDYLRQHNLLLDDYPFFPAKHVAYPSGYTVGLPSLAGGNSMNYEGKCLMYDSRKGIDVETDMPSICIWKSDEMVSIEAVSYTHLTLPTTPYV